MTFKLCLREWGSPTPTTPTPEGWAYPSGARRWNSSVRREVVGVEGDAVLVEAVETTDVIRLSECGRAGEGRGVGPVIDTSGG